MEEEKGISLNDILKRWHLYEQGLAKSFRLEKKKDYGRVYDLLYSDLGERVPRYSPFETLAFGKFIWRRNRFFEQSLFKLRFFKKLIFTEGVGEGRKILEVGGGDGLLSIALSKAGNFPVCTDASKIALRCAAENAKKLKATNIEFRQMDGRFLKFSKGTFDIVISVDFLEHLEAKDAVKHLREVARVLKTGGCYLILTPNKVYHKIEGLHLKTYSYNSLEEILYRSFFIKSSLFTWSPFFLQGKVIFNFRKLLEKFFTRFKVLKGLSLFLGIDPVVVVLLKK